MSAGIEGLGPKNGYPFSKNAGAEPTQGSARLAPISGSEASREAALPNRRRFPWPRPRSAAGQIALLVVASILAAHICAGLAVLALREPWRAEGHPGVAATRLATVARLVDASDPAAREGVLTSAAKTLPALRLSAWDGTLPATGGPKQDLGEGRGMLDRVREVFGPNLDLTLLGTGAGPNGGRILHIGLATPSGARLQAVLPAEPPRPSLQGPLVLTLLFLGLSLAMLSLWATRALTAPLARLAHAAEAFGTEASPLPLPKRGPEEVLAVARALDRMRARVHRLIDDRTQMLAAISHDLRTPITRLRLRAEFIEDEHARAATLRDLDQMNGLVEAALSYVRDGQSGNAGPMPLIDLASIVQTVCDDFSDVGADVTLDRARHVLVRGRPEELQRAITNLVDNAVKYAGAARIAMSAGPHGIAVEVSDEGPGIPDAEHAAMLQPFVRGDRARNLNEASGFGLGLSIVLAIAETHGGRLALRNREGGGLVARIDLPAATGGETSRPTGSDPVPARRTTPPAGLEA
ncbi:ATP-binding protein [Methylobacterium organophilum]|uniref:histidine kinase n=1 Tax=Methylobacterium organophilum TaxID=410 RepID=A0ABQ4T7M9_METOR|nr:ATP-binding protein [Methylobacterium organophilum]GJE26454.1 Adaptive-response sensory-kinase SasA [Methylobacterium organophilum]